MAACYFFGRTLYVSSFQVKSRSYEIFSPQKSLFPLLANEKNAYRSAYVVPRGKFYSFNLQRATTEFLRPNQAHV